MTDLEIAEMQGDLLEFLLSPAEDEKDIVMDCE
jgi:hypothetical protein